MKELLKRMLCGFVACSMVTPQNVYSTPTVNYQLNCGTNSKTLDDFFPTQIGKSEKRQLELSFTAPAHIVKEQASDELDKSFALDGNCSLLAQYKHRAFVNEGDNEGGGPVSPEFSSFESVSTDEMVNLFSGDFKYNLPLLEVPGAHSGGYPITLAYNSGNSPNEEASWVGHGFNLSAGSINRSKSGYPDDVNGGDIISINNMPKNITTSVTPSNKVEIASIKKMPGSKSKSTTFSYNNYSGLSVSKTATTSISRLSFSSTNGSHSVNINYGNIKLMDDKVLASKTFQIKNPLNKDGNSKIKAVAKVSTGDVNMGFNIYYQPYASPTSVTEQLGTSISSSTQIATDVAAIHVGGSGEMSTNTTIFASDPIVQKKAYGYFYLNTPEDSNNVSTKAALLDYHMESDGSASEEDLFIPVVVPDFDQFAVNAEGIGGNFSATWNEGAEMYPNYAVSNVVKASRDGQAHLATTIGVGVGANLGYSRSVVHKHLNMVSSTQNDFESAPSLQQKLTMRFNNDLAGNVFYDDNNSSPFKMVSASTVAGYVPSTQGFINKTFKIDNTLVASKLKANDLQTGKIASSSSIIYYTNSQIVAQLAKEAGPNKPKKLIDYPYLNSSTFIDRTQAAIKDHIGAYFITSGNGTDYAFTIPVYNNYERNLQFNTPPINRIGNNDPIKLNSLIGYANISADVPNMGECHNYPYATSYLLTSIRSSDYVDVDNSNRGIVDDGDLGGFTKFGYDRAYGNDNKIDSAGFYNWRIPYTGLNISQAQLWKKDDDMGSFSTGHKEIYYLDHVETKTHIAYFITNESNHQSIHPRAVGSQVSRKDGRSASQNDFLAASDPNAKGNLRLRNLEKIMLFAKEKTSNGQINYKLLKTVNFAYNYEVWKGMPAADASGIGKLTLKKVWTEDEDIINSRISPYEFEYSYPATASTDYPSKYAHIAQYANSFSGSQLPVFDANAQAVDRWGNYQSDGANRRAHLVTSTNQYPPIGWDPAAYELKQIKLPTGARIDVQYEQDDYRYVQDRKANIMVNFTSGSNSDNDNEYTLNLGAINPELLTSPALQQQYLQELKNYATNNKYVFFKFLYDYRNNNVSPFPIDATTCNVDYVDGYVKLDPQNITLSNGNIKIKLGNGGATVNPAIGGFLNLNVLDGLPRYICYDKFINETRKQAGSCNDLDKMLGSSNPDAAANNILKYAIENPPGLVPLFPICAVINPDYSYLRLPSFESTQKPGKLGGGIRVKRVLMYDKGMPGNAASKVLYGTEYHYVNNDGLSSGVAANEPNEGEDENPLIDFHQKRIKRTTIKKILGGFDREQFEGPFGRSFLPGPSVGYARVETRSIHSGKSDLGYNVSEYFTTKDYPFDMKVKIDGKDLSLISNTTIDIFPYKVPAILPNIPFKFNYLHQVQGYQFIIVNRNGQLKSSSIHRGSAAARQHGDLVYKKILNYYEPWEKVPMVNDIFDTPVPKYCGIDCRITSEKRHLYDVDVSGGLHGDASTSTTPPPVVILSLSASPTISTTLAHYQRYTTSKVITLPNIVRSTEEFKAGVWHKVEHVAFYEPTGSPIITKSIDGFDKVIGNSSKQIFTYNQMAAQDYDVYKPRYVCDNRNIVSTTSTVINSIPNSQIKYFEITLAPATAPVSNSIESLFLSAGDIIEVKSGAQLAYYHIASSQDFNVGSNMQRRFYLQDYNSSSTLGSFNEINVYKSGKKYGNEVPSGSIVTFNAQTPITTAILPQIVSNRNAFLGSMNGIPNFLTNGATTPVNAGTVNFGASNCISESGPCFFGCGQQEAPEQCLQLDCNAALGFACDDEDTAQLLLYLGDVFHTINFSALANVSTQYPWNPSLSPYLTNVHNTICSTSANCTACPLPNSLPFYMDHMPVNWTQYVSGNPDPFIVQPLSATGQYFGVFYNPDPGNIAPILIPFLTSTSASFLNGLVQNDINPRFFQILDLHCDPSITGNFYTDKTLHSRLTYDQNNDGKFDKADVLYCMPAFYLNPLYSPCVITQTTPGLDLKLKTYRDPSNGDLYIAALDYKHNSSVAATISPLVGSFMASKENVDFVLTKKCCTTSAISCDAASNLLPLLINYQKLGKAGGVFTLDKYNKYTVYYNPPDEEAVAVPFFGFCDLAKQSQTIDFVLSNSVTTFKQKWNQVQWPKIYSAIDASTTNEFLKNKRGLWKPYQNFVYKTDRTITNPATSSFIYDKGTYTLEYNGFKEPKVSNKWIVASTVASYSPHGEALSELDALNIPKTISYTTDQTLPNVVAENAPANSIYFESFEQGQWPAGTTMATKGHIGERCLKLSNAAGTTFSVDLSSNAGIKGQTTIIRFWACSNKDYETDIVNQMAPIDMQIITLQVASGSTGGMNMSTIQASKVASSGIWNLYEVETFLPNTPNLTVSLSNTVGVGPTKTAQTSSYFFDDIIIQPKLAKCRAFVYDYVSRKIVGELDDQHFGLLYHYNPEGKLVRKSKETERGVKMIEERQYNNANKVNR